MAAVDQRIQTCETQTPTLAFLPRGPRRPAVRGWAAMVVAGRPACVREHVDKRAAHAPPVASPWASPENICLQALLDPAQNSPHWDGWPSVRPERQRRALASGDGAWAFAGNDPDPFGDRK